MIYMTFMLFILSIDMAHASTELGHSAQDTMQN